jgi:GT2 family glycosyltransferase
MRAVGASDFQKSVAYATSTVFGVGNSQFHFNDFKGFTDSVYLGAWKREIFDSLGYFDERMIRNQDDEFHYRARNAGYKIFQDPEIISYYYPRDNIRTLFSQYYQYGLYKPLVLKKVKSEMKLRHLMPSSFILYFALLPLLYKFIHPYFAVFGGLYVTLLLFYSLKNSLIFKSKLWCLLIYPTLHAAYGLGFLKGLINTPKEEPLPAG